MNPKSLQYNTHSLDRPVWSGLDSIFTHGLFLSFFCFLFPFRSLSPRPLLIRVQQFFFTSRAVGTRRKPTLAIRDWRDTSRSEEACWWSRVSGATFICALLIKSEHGSLSYHDATPPPPSTATGWCVWFCGSFPRLFRGVSAATTTISALAAKNRVIGINVSSDKTASNPNSLSGLPGRHHEIGAMHITYVLVRAKKPTPPA